MKGEKMKQSILILFIIMISSIVNAADVTLKWDANSEEDLAGYRIYYDTDSGEPYDGDSINGRSPVNVRLEDLKDKSNPEFTLKNLNTSSRWYFVVTAYDTEGLESDYSNEVSTYNYTKPGTPSLNIKVIVNVEMTTN